MKTHIALFLLIFLFIISVETLSQSTPHSLERGNSLSNGVDAYQSVNDFSNLSSVLFLRSSFVQSVTENRYLMKEFMRERIDVMTNYRGNLFAFQASHFGYQHYGELVLGVGYGKLLGHKFALAMQFFYWFNHASHYASVHSLSFNISASYQINSQIQCGFLVTNPARLRYGLVDKEAPPLPLMFSVDVNYKLNKHFFSFLQLEKGIVSPLKVRLGGYYHFSKPVALGFGFTVPNPELYLGVRLVWTHFQMEIRSLYHCKLGLSSSLSLYIPFML